MASTVLAKTPRLGAYFISTLAICFSLISCKSHSDQNRLSGVLVDDPSMYGLMQIIAKPQFRVCLIHSTAKGLESSTDDQVEKTKKDIQYAFKVWMEPLSEFFEKDFGKEVVFLTQKDGCRPTLIESVQSEIANPHWGPSVSRDAELNASIADLSVLIHPSIREPSVTYGPAGAQWLRTNGTVPTTIHVHEIGHTLGLADSYDSYLIHPVSIMNRQAGMDIDGHLYPHSNGHLYPDDIYSLKQSFCALHHQSWRQKCASLPYISYADAFYPRLNTEGLPAYSLGVTLREATCRVRSNFGLSGEESLLEVVSVTANSSAESAGFRVGDLIFRFNGFPKTVAQFKHALLTSPSQDVVVGIRRRNSEGVCDVRDNADLKVRLDINGQLREAQSPDDVFAIKATEQLSVGDVVVTRQPVSLHKNAVIPKGVFLTIVSAKDELIYVRFFEHAGWIQRNTVRHAPLDR